MAARWVGTTVGAMDGDIEPHGRVYGVSYPPNRPASDRSLRLLVGVDLGRHICQISKWNRGQIRFPAESGSDPIGNPIGLAGVGSCLGQSPLSQGAAAKRRGFGCW